MRSGSASAYDANASASFNGSAMQNESPANRVAYRPRLKRTVVESIARGVESPAVPNLNDSVEKCFAIEYSVC